MSRIILFLRILIGGLFIFSGLVKANDPLGLAYKMEEFFEIWHTLWMVPFSTLLSVWMNALEIVSGLALLLGWQNKWNVRLLLALILFFTALTGYTYYTGFPKTCGCFGDCLPISAAVSFYKDIALLLGILVLLRFQSKIRPLFPSRVAGFLTLGAALFVLGMQYYVLRHLPWVDCLPYHVGQNLPEARKQPPPPPGSTVMFVYERGGKEVAFSADQFPEDFNTETYRFIRRYETGEIPQAAIQGLVFFGSSGQDTTESVLTAERIILVFSENLLGGPPHWGRGWSRLLDVATAQQVPVVLITNDPTRWTNDLRNQYPKVQVVGCDRTPIRTAARVNPTVYSLEKGVVLGKWALVDFPSPGIPSSAATPRGK